jgi:ketosteroid isomerase-like protein
MRGYRFKRWQRILIVLSIFWMAFGGVWGWRHANDRVDAEFKQCLTQIKTAAEVQECRAQRAAALVPNWFGATVAAAGPVALFWLGLYALIFAARRLKRAGRRQPEVAVIAEPSRQPRDELEFAPAPLDPQPTALASGPVALGSQTPTITPAPADAPAGSMSSNRRTVEKYIEGFRRSDHQAILSCLTDDIEWMLPGMINLKGKAAFDREIENPNFVGSPDITLTRVTEQGNVVVAEGHVRAAKREGGILNAVFCDVFDMREAKIRRLVSYLVEVKQP